MTADPQDRRPPRAGAKKIKLTPERKALFLQELAEHGIIGWAARQASPGAEGECRRTFEDERERDPEFEAAWQDALKRSDENILNELHRRAIKGIDETGKDGAVRTRYSDQLMALILKSKRFGDKFTDRTKVEHSGTTRHDFGLGELSKESQAQLREILRREADQS
jgi:hypothetical protein